MMIGHVLLVALLLGQVQLVDSQTDDTNVSATSEVLTSTGFVQFFNDRQIAKSKYSQVVRGLWEELDSARGEARTKIVNELADTVSKLKEENQFDEALSNAKLLYAKSEVPRARRIAFGVMAKLDPAHVAQVSREVVFEIPSVTCHGRLLDAIRERLRDNNAWVLGVKLEGTQRRSSSEAWGTIAILTVTVEKQKSDQQVIQAMKDAVLGIESWSILKAIPISQLK